MSKVEEIKYKDKAKNECLFAKAALKKIYENKFFNINNMYLYASKESDFTNVWLWTFNNIFPSDEILSHLHNKDAKKVLTIYSDIKDKLNEYVQAIRQSLHYRNVYFDALTMAFDSNFETGQAEYPTYLLIQDVYNTNIDKSTAKNLFLYLYESNSIVYGKKVYNRYSKTYKEKFERYRKSADKIFYMDLLYTILRKSYEHSFAAINPVEGILPYIHSGINIDSILADKITVSDYFSGIKNKTIRSVATKHILEYIYTDEHLEYYSDVYTSYIEKFFENYNSIHDLDAFYEDLESEIAKFAQDIDENGFIMTENLYNDNKVLEYNILVSFLSNMSIDKLAFFNQYISSAIIYTQHTEKNQYISRLEYVLKILDMYEEITPNYNDELYNTLYNNISEIIDKRFCFYKRMREVEDMNKFQIMITELGTDILNMFKNEIFFKCDTNAYLSTLSTLTAVIKSGTKKILNNIKGR